MALELPGHTRPYDRSLPAACYRRYSPVLAAFPWQWDGIISAPQNLEQLAEKIPEYKNFLMSLHHFENHMFSLSPTQAASDVLNVLGLKIQYPPLPHDPAFFVPAHKKELTPLEFQNVASVVAAYAFAEVLAIQADPMSRRFSSIPVPLNLPPSQTKVQQDLRGMETISDIYDVLLGFRKVMTKMPISDDRTIVLKSDHSLATLLQMAARSNASNDYHKVENNFIFAGLHMNAMKSIVFGEDQVPDLPRDVHKSKYPLHIDAGIVKDIYSQDTTLPDAVAEDPSILTNLEAMTAFSTSGPGMLRNALQVADLLTPVFLLRPKQLAKMSLHRHTLLELAAKIRPCKTELLLKVEEKIWAALFILVRGRSTPLEVLQKLLEDLPWPEIEAAASMARAPSSTAFAFDPARALPSLPAITSSRNLSLLRDQCQHLSNPSLQGEGTSADCTACGLKDQPAEDALSGDTGTSGPVTSGEDSEGESELSTLDSSSEDLGVDENSPRPGSSPMLTGPSGKALPAGGPNPNRKNPKKASKPPASGNLKDAAKSAGKPRPKPKQAPVQPSGKLGQDSKSASKRGTKRPRIDQGDTVDDPIDVDQFNSIFEPSVVKAFVWPKQINFESLTVPRRLTCRRSFVAFDAEGGETTFTPQAHYQTFLTSFTTFMDRAKDYYIKDKPRFLSEPEQSCLAITDYETFNGLTDLEKRTFMAGKTAAIVRRWPVDPTLKFDARGLRTLSACFTAPLDLLDYSLKLAGKHCTPVTVTGKVQDLLENAHPDGKILNGLDFPKWNSHLDPHAFSVDIVAWEYTRGLHFSDDRGALYPGPDMNWSLAAHEHATTNTHVDADGTFTKNLVGCGSKGWGFLVERSSPRLSSVDFFLDKGFKLSSVKEDSQYDIEFVVLKAGDMLLMKPNTPHFIITLEHSICYGGHSFSTDTMQETLVGLIHTFVLHNFLTNAVHHPSRLLLRRILVFYYVGLLEDKIPEDDPSAGHLPDYRNIDGFLNLLCVCVLVVMSNVLDFRTYSSPNQYDDTQADDRLKALMDEIDLNAIPENERKAICYARGIALHIMAWIRTYCTIRGPDRQEVEDLPSRFFVQIASATLNYKARAEEAKVGGGPHCTFEHLARQVSNLIECDPYLAKMWQRRDQFPSDSLELADKATYTVEWDAGWEKGWSIVEHDFLAEGTTAFDKRYFNSYNQWCKYQVAEVLPKLGPVAKKLRRS